MPMSALRSRIFRSLAMFVAMILAPVVVVLGPEPRATLQRQDAGDDESHAYAVLGARRLEPEYAAWKRAHEARGGDRAVHFTLARPQELGHMPTDPAGEAHLDLIGGK